MNVHRCGLPNFQAFDLDENEHISFHTDVFLAPNWKSKRNVHVISTIHGTEMITTEKVDYQTGRGIIKTISVKDYNENRWLLIKSEMQMSFSESLRTSFKW